MTLETAVERYRERCQFFAWPVYECLARHHRSKLRVLRYLGTVGKPATATEIAAAVVTRGAGAKPKTAETHADHLLLSLWRNQLVGRTRRPNRAYAYHVTLLGELVLACAESRERAEGA